MVSDILNADNELIDDYFKEKLNEKNKTFQKQKEDER